MKRDQSYETVRAFPHLSQVLERLGPGGKEVLILGDVGDLASGLYEDLRLLNHRPHWAAFDCADEALELPFDVVVVLRARGGTDDGVWVYERAWALGASVVTVTVQADAVCEVA